MAAIAELEASIQTLPPAEFLVLLEWMTNRHLEVLSSGEFESPELEAELLHAVESPRHAVTPDFFEGIRSEAAALTH